MHSITHVLRSMLLMSLLAAVIALPQPTMAQETDGSGDADQDLAVTIEDLGVDDPILLPDNPFYFLKELSRNFSAFFTFDPVEKAEKRLEFAAEKIAEAQKLLDEGAEDDRLANAIENFQEEYDRIENALNAVNADEDGAEELLQELLDKQVKSQKIIDRLEAKANGNDNARIKKARNNIEKRVANAISRLEDNPEALEEKITTVLSQQEGSNFAPLKHLEVLQGLIEKLPEQAQDAVQQAYDKQLAQLQERLGEDAQDRFANYLENLDGSEDRRFKILERLENEDLPEEIKEKISEAKEKKIEQLKNQIDLVESDELKEELLQKLEDGDFKSLKILKKIDDLSDSNSLDELIEKARNNAETNLEARLQQAQQNGNLDELLEKLGFNGDSDEIATIEDLDEETIADLELKEKLRRKSLSRIQDQLNDANSESVREKISNRLAGEEPRNIDALERALENAPDSAKPALRRVLNKHVDRIENALEDDSEKSDRIKRLLENDETLRERFRTKSRAIIDRIESNDNVTEEQKDAVIDRAQDALREDLRDGAPEIRERLRRQRIRENATDSENTDSEGTDETDTTSSE